MHPYRYIADDTAFRSWYANLPAEQYAVAVDLEAEFNLHIYGEHFCLLQVYDGTTAVAIDPQTVSIGLIKEFLENRQLLKITYDCASDRQLLYKNHGILMNCILDLRPAVQLLGLQKQGLSSVLEEILGIEPARGKKRFQQYNWTRRPVHEDALAYAIDDVVHLYRLRDALMQQLAAAGQTDRFLVENFAVQDTLPETDRKPGMLRGGRVRKLKPAQLKLLERLHAVREEAAREVNLPPNTVFPNRDLYALAAGQGNGDPAAIKPSRAMPAERYQRLVRDLSDILQSARG
ncbi:HRDC domain-containing protein [Spirochaeta africana]|nr:HRDC domain-containing protein [Spirochaeta africana]